MSRVRAAVALLALAALAPAAIAQTAEVDRDARWRADLAFLSKELAAKHKNLFHTLPREEWDARVGELDERIPELEEREIAAEFARLVASVGDAHTTVQGGSPPFLPLSAPIELRWFPDGVRLIAAPGEHAAAVGGRVTAIGGVAIDEAWRRASEVIAHENEAWLRAQVPSWLAAPGFLHALGLADDDANGSYAIAPDDGPDAAIAVDVRVNASLRPITRAGPKTPPPWLARRRDYYWFDYLPESKTLFLQFNRCSDDPKQPFADLVKQLFEAADREQPDRLVVDLRHNSGGNSLVIAPLFTGFGSHRSLRTRGHLFAVIGPQTFSSGMMNAVQLKDGFGAILVGEPTGGRPNGYGEVKTFELPNSKIRVGYCTKYFQQSAVDVESVAPDVAAPVTFADWKSGRDPALAAILEWKQP